MSMRAVFKVPGVYPEPRDAEESGSGEHGCRDCGSLRGRGMQRGAEQEIEELGANVEDIQSRMDQLTAPSMMSDEVLAAATRNAAILGQQFQPDPRRSWQPRRQPSKLVQIPPQ